MGSCPLAWFQTLDLRAQSNLVGNDDRWAVDTIDNSGEVLIGRKTASEIWIRRGGGSVTIAYELWVVG